MPDDLRRDLTRLRRDLAQQIASGELRPGERLGAERTLAAELGVSRAVLRQALAALEEGGMIRRVPGRGGGTFVAGKIDRDMSGRIQGIPALLRSQGVTHGTHVLSARLAEPDDVAAQALRLRPGDLAVDLLRLRLADGTPFSLERAQLPAKRFPGLLDLPLGGSVYELLEEHYGASPAGTVERVEARLASDGEATMLEMERGAALLSITRTTTDAAGVPIEHGHDLFRADRTRLIVRTGTTGTAGTVGTAAATEHGPVPGRAHVVQLRANLAADQEGVSGTALLCNDSDTRLRSSSGDCGVCHDCTVITAWGA